MLAELGYTALLAAFAASLFSIITCIVGYNLKIHRLTHSGRNAALVTFPLVLLSLSLLLYGLITEQYQISYVWSVSDPRTPMFYRITALWGSQQGSLLFWSLTMSVFTFFAIRSNWRDQQQLMPYAVAFMMMTLAFFLGLSIFLENPFERYWITEDNQVIAAVWQPVGTIHPSSARLAETAEGLNPLLRHFGMIIHPPLLYLGFVGFVVPFSFAMAALASGELSTNWIKVTRKWTIIAWLFLSLGLLIGGRWAYDVLGWGGYWGWDPVENAAFLPWLVGTAFLHSVLTQERRGMLKVWNMFLIISTFTAVLFATLATRSGIIESVHSFANSEIGMPMFIFWAMMTFVSVGLVIWRWWRGNLRDENDFNQIFSRETFFVLNNMIFMFLFVAIFWGSFGAPILSTLVLDTEITLGVSYFNKVTPPLFLAMYILMGVTPLMAWGTNSLRQVGRSLIIPFILSIASLGVIGWSSLLSLPSVIGYAFVFLSGYVALYEIYRGVAARRKAHTETWWTALYRLLQRNRRRHGGYIIHFGIAVIGIGVIGSTLFQQETQQTLQVGESLSLGGYDMTFTGLDTGQIAQDGRVMDIAHVEVNRNGQPVANLRPRRDLFLQADDTILPMTIASANSTLADDFYVLFVGWREVSPDQATFKVYVNPLINFVWLGGLILVLGTILSAWPSRSPVRSYSIVPPRNYETTGQVSV